MLKKIKRAKLTWAHLHCIVNSTENNSFVPEFEWGDTHEKNCQPDPVPDARALRGGERRDIHFHHAHRQRAGFSEPAQGLDGRLFQQHLSASGRPVPLSERRDQERAVRGLHGFRRRSGLHLQDPRREVFRRRGNQGSGLRVHDEVLSGSGQRRVRRLLLRHCGSGQRRGLL